jgi:DNA-directed RNA polymerase specialized sigma24 family protein
MGVGVWARLSDEELLDASRREPAAFGVFYERHEERMLRYFVSRVGDAEVAADLTAETFAAALAGAHRFRARKGPAVAWLFGIARNTLAVSKRRGRVEAPRCPARSSKVVAAAPWGYARARRRPLCRWLRESSRPGSRPAAKEGK